MAHTKGLEEVLKRMNVEIEKIKNNTVKGMIRGAIIIRRDMEFTTPLTPVNLGNLRSSFYVVTSKAGTIAGGSAHFKGKEAAELGQQHIGKLQSTISKINGTSPKLAMGYSAYYAWCVHENMAMRFVNRPGSGPKWFEAAIKRNEKKFLDVVREEATIK